MKDSEPGTALKAEPLDPTNFGLSSRVLLEAVGPHRIRIVKRRKSRIIMKDGRQLLQQAQQIKKYLPGVTVEVATTAPVCSKTRAYLKEHGVTVIPFPNKIH